MTFQRPAVFQAIPILAASLALSACSMGIDPTLGIASASRALPVQSAPLVVPAPGAVETAVLGEPTSLGGAPKVGRLDEGDLGPNGASMATYYAARTVDDILIPAVDPARLGADHVRTEVAYSGPEAPGDIVIDTGNRHLYLIEPNGRAIRYGIAVGREGFGWQGTERLSRTAKWPTWTPPASMIEREPELEQWAEGMPGSAQNPLGARALYLGNTLYRIHGTNKPYSIGKAASSGCFRMTNQDVLDLYERVKQGAKVIVRDRTPMVMASR